MPVNKTTYKIMLVNNIFFIISYGLSNFEQRYFQTLSSVFYDDEPGGGSFELLISLHPENAWGSAYFS